ncbi:hypothetical protein MHYP_G00198970 [Metynnis hypsauchen]
MTGSTSSRQGKKVGVATNNAIRSWATFPQSPSGSTRLICSSKSGGQGKLPSATGPHSPVPPPPIYKPDPKPGQQLPGLGEVQAMNKLQGGRTPAAQAYLTEYKGQIERHTLYMGKQERKVHAERTGDPCQEDEHPPVAVNDTPCTATAEAQESSIPEP